MHRGEGSSAELAEATAPQTRLLNRRAFLGLPEDELNVAEISLPPVVKRHWRPLAAGLMTAAALMPQSLSEPEFMPYEPEAAIATQAGEAVSLDLANPATTQVAVEMAAPAVPEVAAGSPPVVPNSETTSSTTLPPIAELTVAAQTVANPPLAPFQIRGYGADVSWPQCGRQDIPQFDFGIVGINEGSPFEINPCLSDLAEHFRHNLALYVNTDYPGSYRGRDFLTAGPRQCTGPEDLGCMAYNYGYHGGLFAVDVARQNGVASTFWWLDVEVNPRTWTHNVWTRNPAENVESIKGTMDAILQNAPAYVGMPVEIGFYSTPRMWDLITGGWRNGLPNWVATGPRPAHEALAYCVGKEFTWGPTLMVQHVDEAQNLDHNQPCNPPA